MAGSSAIIGIVMLLFVFGGLGIFLYIYTHTTAFKNPGDPCVPTTKEKVKNASKYALDSAKKCKVSTCADKFTAESGKCVPKVVTPVSSSSSSSSSTPDTSAAAASLKDIQNQIAKLGATGSSSSSKTGTPCAMPIAVPNAASSEYDSEGVCKLVSCQANYAISTDGTKCEKSATTNAASATFNCNNEFSLNDTITCSSEGEAGVSWSWNNNASSYCQRQIKYFKVDLVSSRDRTKKFTTYLPPESLEAGIKGMTAAWIGSKTLEFTVDAFNSAGVSLFEYPRKKIINPKESGVTCASVGITPISAYHNWNENDNITKLTWSMREPASALGSFHVEDTKGNIFSENEVGLDVNASLEIPGGYTVITDCMDTAGGQYYDWSKISEFGPHIAISHRCWSDAATNPWSILFSLFGDINETWKEKGTDIYSKSTLPK